MVEDRLSNNLTNMGYRRIDSNSRGIYLFYRSEGDDLIVVSVIQAYNGTEFTQPQYKHILEQIKTNFMNSHSQKVQLLSLVLTQSPDQLKHFCSAAEEDSHWIIDTKNNRLLIYENQPSEVAGLRATIEQLLEEEYKENQLYHNTEPQKEYGQTLDPEMMQEFEPRKLKIFTLINTIIIAINVIVYLVMHYTGAFGGEGQILSRGALSWYYVKEEKEYYRIITSMFMHADWSHLINNMIVLLFVGDNLERAAGKFRYLIIYLSSGILAGITSISYNMWKDYGNFSFEHSVFSIGASGAIFGIVGAMLYIVIVNKGRLEDISTRQIILFIVFSLYGGVANSRIDQAAHVGGFLAGLLLAAILYRRPRKNDVTIEE